MKRGHILAGVILATISSASFGADLGIANGFNAFIFGSAMTNGGHSDGAVAVKNNWTGSGYDALQANKPGTIGSDNKLGMYVGGSVSFSNGGSVNNSGNARVKGNFFSQNPFNMNGGSLYIGGTKSGNVNGTWSQGTDTVDVSVFSSQLQYSLNQSSAISALGGEVINTTDPNNWHVNANLQAGSQKVYQIGADKLSNIRTLDFSNLATTDTVLINVTGSGPVNDFGVTVNTNTGSFTKILWNYTGNSFKVGQRSLHGSLLAPNATIDQYQNIDGNLIANNWNNYNNAELHYGGFNGAAPVPEPATMIALGLGAAALLRRKRNS